MSRRRLSIALLFCLILASLVISSPNAAQLNTVHAAPASQSEPSRPQPRAGDSPAGIVSPTIAPIGALNNIATALNIPLQDVISISLLGSDVDAFGRGQSSLGYHFPIAGSEFLVMATGLASSAELPNTQGNLSTVLDGQNNQQNNDLVQLELRLSTPPGVNCASFDFSFYSEEFPEWVGHVYNDAFTAEFGGTDLTIVGSEIIAPLNFAFDTEGNLITVNTVSGVTEPTASTYDGKTPLRRAQIGVEPDENITLVFSIQDLGDSVWDSAVFIDNFFWSNNADCGGFVEPPPTPMSALQLHMPTALPTNANIRPKATVTNLSQAPTAYTLKLELRRGFGLLDTKTYPLLLGPGESYQQEADFGQRGPDNYYIRADLLQGLEIVESQSAPFTIGESYLKLEDMMDELTKAAHEELGQGQDITVGVLSRAVLEVTKEIVVKAINMFATVVSGLGESISEQLAEEVGEEFLGWFFDFSDVLDLTGGDLVRKTWRQKLNSYGYNDRHDAVDTSAQALLDDAADNVFTWFDTWDADVAHYRALLLNRNEAAEVGYGINFDLDWPPYHLMTLTETEGKFYFLVDKYLPVIEKILQVALVLLIVAAAVVGIFTIAATAGVATPGIVVMIQAALPAAISFYKAAGWSKAIGGGILVIFMSILVSFTALDRTAVTVVDEHGKAMEDFSNRIGLLNAAPQPAAALQTTTRVDGYEVMVELPGTRSANAAPIYAQLFRGDGQLLAIEPFGADGAPAHAVSWRVPPGSYWTVVTTPGTNNRTTTRQQAMVTPPEIALNLIVPDQQLQAGETITVQATVTNQTAQTVDSLSLMVRTLPMETLVLRNFELAPNQTRAFDFEFVPPEAGSYIVQAYVSHEDVPVVAWQEGVIVGSGPALSLNATTGDSYAPGSDVVWNTLLENSGNQSTSTPIDIETYRRSDSSLVHDSSLAVSLSAGEQRTVALSVLPDAAPGAYTTYVRLDEVVRLEADFLVTADGALFAMTQVTPQFVDVGQPATVMVHVQNEAYTPIAALVTAQIALPSGDIVPLSLAESGLGTYQGSYTPGTAGTYSVRVTASKPDYVISAAETYLVADEPSFLVAAADDQLVLNETKELELVVENETGAAIAGATVLLSSSTGAQVEVTDNNGVAAFLVSPLDEEPVAVKIEKPGFADTNLALPIAIESDTTAPLATWLPPQLTNDPTLNIPGHTEPGTTVIVQGNPVPVDAEGDFEAIVSLHEGSNTVTGTVSDAAGNQTPLAATIVLDTTPPALTVNWPAGDPEDWGPSVQVTGNTEANLHVVINGVGVTASGTGSFTAWIAVGEPPAIIVTATDRAGNAATRSFNTVSLLFLPISLQIPYVPPILPLHNGNFESGPANWTQSSSHNWPIIVNSDQVEDLPTHSGIWIAWLGGDDNEVSYIEQTVTVPADRPYLTYYHGIASRDACGYDFGRVLVNGTVVEQYTLCRNTNTPDWTYRAVNLSAYAGQTVALQFRATTDASLYSNLLIDDVAFQNAAAAAARGAPVPFRWPADLIR